MFAEPGQHFCGSGRLQEASAMKAWRKFLGLQDGADPMEMALLDDIFGGETQVCLVSQIILKKTTGAYEILLRRLCP